ncbi:MAG: PAS domain S-box protein, partial [Rhodospirillales bacterium]|nr:PAS domain S-box protein [Rhodospirillales bacterium]
PEGGTALSIVDITELKNTENALRKSEALFRAVVNHSPTKIHIKDVEGRYALINKEAEKLFGVADEEGRGKTSYDLFPKEVADAFMAHDRSVIDSGNALEKEEEFTLEDGVHTFLTVKFPIYDLDGVAAVGAIGTDITERKRAEETVRRLAAAIEGLSENFALYGPDDRLIICNRNYRDLNAAIAEATRPGVTFEQHARAMVEHGLAPQAVGREEAWVRERLERHRNPGGPIEVARQDGRWFLVHEQRMADGSTATIATDITERKRAEQELEHQKMLFEVVFRDVPDAMVLADTDRKVMMCNPSITRTFGYEPRELLGKNTGILYATREEYERQGKLRFNPDAEFKLDPYVASYRRKSGELFPGETVGTPIRDRDGNTLGFIAVIRDVTERQKAEEMLKESEERFRSVLDSSPSAVSLKDKDNRFLLVNNTFATWMKADAKEIIGKTIFDLYPKEEAEFIAQNNREVFTTGKSYVGERKGSFKDGTVRDLIVHKRPIRSVTGEVVAVSVNMTDITERKRAEEALRKSEARLANILDNSPAPIYFKDPHGRFLIANRQYERMYRVKFDDIRGKTSKQIFGGSLGDQFWGHDQLVLKNRKMIEREEQIFGRTYLTLKFPIVDQAGELLGLGGIETDVTGLSEMLMNETLGPLGSPRYREYAEDIHTSGNHLLGLISEVLDLSKIEAGELEIIESEIDVTDAVSTCVRMIEGRSPVEAPRVSVEFANGLPRLLGDERRLKQILLNLLGNAVKFTPQDGEVSVAARVSDGGRFTIEVTDTGIGIAAEDIPKVLEPFGQVRDVFTRKHEGTGLGLYLAKSFTEMHGGTLDIASALGKGTTVTLRFPKERTVARH